MKSGLTRAEHNVAASLMGRFYDWRDHTYCTINMDIPPFDADTLEVIEWGNGEFSKRRSMVLKEEIGCEDGPFKLDPK